MSPGAVALMPPTRFPLAPLAAAAAGVAIVAITLGIVIPGGRDAGRTLEFSLTPDDPGVPPADLVRDAADVLRRRLRELGSDAAVTHDPPSGRITVEVRGVHDWKPLVRVLNNPSRLTFSIVTGNPGADRDALLQPYGGILPDSLLIAPVAWGQGGDNAVYLVSRVPALTGRDIETANRTSDEHNRPAIQLRLTPEGVKKLSEVTGANVGRPLAILLNGEVVSAPVIESAISQAEVRITGSFTLQEAGDLALLLRSGSLPGKLTLLEERELAGVPGYRVAKYATIGGGVLAGWVALFLFVGFLTNRRSRPA
jgi:preprotein translocase subunit SecD